MASQERYNLPRELDSDQQAAVLYSPFRERSLNPQSWIRKVKFWENLLAETALERRTVTFNVNMLSQMFERKGMKPKCLDTVVEEMKISGRIRSIEDYKRASSWLSWAFSALVKQPLSWGVSHLLTSAKKESAVFVWPEVVKKLCQEVLELHQSRTQNDLTESLLAMDELRNLCRTLIVSDQDFEVVLTQLERDRKVIITETQDKEIVVKFCKKGELSVSAVRETDLHIYRIQLTLKQLEREIELLSSRAQRKVADAKIHLREGRQTMAKHCLRQKRNILRQVDKMSGSLTILADIIHTIEDASTNEMVVRACEAGTVIMRSINKDVTVETVDSVLDDVREALENQEEINIAMNSGLPQDDSEQLEHELEQLLKETTSENRTDDMINSLVSLAVDDLGLPNVPTHSLVQPSHHQGRDKASASTQPLPS